MAGFTFPPGANNLPGFSTFTPLTGKERLQVTPYQPPGYETAAPIDWTVTTQQIADLAAQGFGFINVMNYGAVGNGVTDDAPAINAAIAAAAQTGYGIVWFPPLLFAIGSTLVVGNGTTSSVSTIAGIVLQGTGVPPPPAWFYTGYPITSSNCTKLIWIGAQGGTMIQIQGPLQGWGVRNFFMEGGGSSGIGLAGTGIAVTSGAYGDSSLLSIVDCQTAGIYQTTVPHAAFGPSVNTDNFTNNWRQIAISVPFVNGAKGIVLTGAADGISNTDYNDFTSVAMTLPTVLATGSVAYGIYLQSCDSNVFRNVHFFNGDDAHTYPIAFDYTINTAFPTANRFYSVDLNGGQAIPYIVNGTPSSASTPNYFEVNPANGSPFVVAQGGLNQPTQADTTNISYGTNIVASAKYVGLTSSFNSGILLNQTPDGLYRLSYYVVVTSAVSASGSLQFFCSWQDGFGTPAFAGTSIAVAADHHDNQSVVLRNRGQVLFNVTGTALTGSPTYDLFVSMERMA